MSAELIAQLVEKDQQIQELKTIIALLRDEEVTDPSLAFKLIVMALNDDPDYAYSWYANLLMMMIDAGISRDKADDATRRILQLLFHYDADKCIPKIISD